MKIHILFEFQNSPYGGGNQFLKALRDEFKRQRVYANSVEKADIILINSHHLINKAIAIKKRYPEKIFVHRIDGPISSIRGIDRGIDGLIYLANNVIMDGTVFQSSWSRRRNLMRGMKKPLYETVIINAPDPGVFNRKDKPPFFKNRKIKIIATSWSKNWNKGFRTYEWLDENLDFSKYEMRFIGNSPTQFSNIVSIPPIYRHRLAKEIKKADIYITASRSDPCSNSLIEAMHCGLPAIGLKDGGHTEIIGKGGELFNKDWQIPKLLDKIVRNYHFYQNRIDIPEIKDIAQKYYDFAMRLHKQAEKSVHEPKKLNVLSELRLCTKLFIVNAKKRFSK